MSAFQHVQFFIPHVVYFMSVFFRICLANERKGSRLFGFVGNDVCVSDVWRIRAYIYKAKGERYMYRDLIRVCK